MSDDQAAAPDVVRFAEYEIDVAQAQLRRHGEPVKIRHQTWTLLCYLARHADRVVGREELAEHLWGSHSIDFDQRLNAAVRDLRKTLGDPARIRTLPRKGYRFIADVGTAPDAPAARARWPWAVVAIVGVVAGLWLTRSPAPAPEEVLNQTYVEARALLDSGDPSHLDTAQALLERLLTDEPEHARAWDALAQLHMSRRVASAEKLPAAREAVYNALRIDPDFVDALRRAATLALVWDRDWPEAERLLARATTIATDDARVYHDVASLYYLQGDLVEGEAMLMRGLTIDPLSMIMNADLAWYRTVSGDYDGALETCALIARIDATSQQALSCAIYPNLLAGKIADAARQARRHLEAGGKTLEAHLEAADVLSRYWQTALNATQAAAANAYVDPVALARLHAHVGDPDATLQALEQAVAERSTYAPYIPLFPEFRGLHSLARFTEMVDQIGTPAPARAVLLQRK